MTCSAVSQSDTQDYGSQPGVAQLVFAIAEQMAVLDAILLSIALVDLDAGPEGVREQFPSRPRAAT